MSQPKALRSRARGYLTELRRATCSVESHSSFCSPAEFLAYIRWENLSTLLLPSGLSLSPPAYQSFLNASYYPVFSFFWNLIPFFLPARPVSALDGLHLIKFCTFLSPFRMGLTNPGRALGRSCLLSISPKLLTLSGIPPFSTNSFRLASLLALLV